MLALIAALSGSEACQSLLLQAFNLAASAEGQNLRPVVLALELLTTLAQEGDQLNKQRRQEVAQATSNSFTSLVSLVHGLLNAFQSGSKVPAVQAVACLRAWLNLDPAGTGTVCMSPGTFNKAHGGLFQLLFQLLVSADGDVCQAASEFLCDLLGPGSQGSDAECEHLALVAAVHHLTALKGAISQPGAEQQAAAVASVATAIAERDADFIAGNTQPAEALAGTQDDAALSLFALSTALRHTSDP